MFILDNSLCMQCGTCVNECHKDALALVDNMIKHDSERCIMCGHCLAVCPRDAIMIDGDGYDCGEVEDLSFAARPTRDAVRNMILLRRSERRFTDDKVTEDEINGIIEAGRYAPTSLNSQDNAFLIVTDPEKRKELLEDTISTYERINVNEDGTFRNELIASKCAQFRESGKDGFYFNAPVIIFVFSDSEVDGSICAATMGFMAQGEQLGYCMARLPVYMFEDEAIREKWQAPEGKQCVIALLIGNPDSEYFCSVPRKIPPITWF